MNKRYWEKNIFELIRRTSTDLPNDVELALRRALSKEKKGSSAYWSLSMILDNVASARENDVPLCQDTGTLMFYFKVPVGFDTNMLASRVRAAVAKATRKGYLRQNTFDSITGESYETNIAPSAPVFHFEQGARKTVEVVLVMKGGGCENVGIQYSLPDVSLNAGRDIDGVRKCILDAVWRAQGHGCAPGILGVCVGGDRATGFAYSKEQLKRKINDKSSVKVIADLEKRILQDSQKLGIGPMGVGGQTTLLGVKIGALSRLPASFFVSISYMCWAFRRRGVILGSEGGVKRWLY